MSGGGKSIGAPGQTPNGTVNQQQPVASPGGNTNNQLPTMAGGPFPLPNPSPAGGQQNAVVSNPMPTPQLSRITSNGQVMRQFINNQPTNYNPMLPGAGQPPAQQQQPFLSPGQGQNPLQPPQQIDTGNFDNMPGGAGGGKGGMIGPGAAAGGTGGGKGGMIDPLFQQLREEGRNMTPEQRAMTIPQPMTNYGPGQGPMGGPTPGGPGQTLAQIAALYGTQIGQPMEPTLYDSNGQPSMVQYG